jgi:CDP-glucose 4,6-dehydratase
VEKVDIAPALPRPAFWRGRRVLVTGHTGFKGSWLALWLAELGATVFGLALPPDTNPAHYTLAAVDGVVQSTIADLRDPEATAAVVTAADPEIVLHLAAQSLVRRGLATPAETFASNVMGTAHLLDALRSRARPRTVLVVTSDKVYAGHEDMSAFTEGDELGGNDPYSASKAAVELLVRAYRASYFAGSETALATARGGNVVGGGDFAADRLVPDAVRAAMTQTPLVLRHPEATRPWQHVLDCLCGYLVYAEALGDGKAVPPALNFAPDARVPAPTVGEVATIVCTELGHAASWQHCPDPASRERMTLRIDASLANEALGWRSRFSGRDAVVAAAKWYGDWLGGDNPAALTRLAIADFMR